VDIFVDKWLLTAPEAAKDAASDRLPKSAAQNNINKINDLEICRGKIISQSILAILNMMRTGNVHK
jgi:hypothetical protein